MDLTNKVVVITGASSGIGTAIAQALTGARLVITGRNEDRLNEVAASLDGEVLPVVADVTVTDDCERVARVAVARFGTINVLVNNAGFAPPASLVETTDEILDVTIDSCLKGVLKMSRAVVPTMLDNGGGTVLTISSVAGKGGYGNRTAYCAAKWGVQGFTEALRDELGDRGIRAYTVNPGAVATPWWGRTSDPQTDAVMDKMIQPEEVAEAVRWVLSQPARIDINEIVMHTHRSPWA